MLRKLLFAGAVVLATAGLVLERPLLAWAQQQDNLDLGNVVTGLSSSTPAAVGVYNSSDILASSARGIQCYYAANQTANQPVVTVGILGKDGASGVYYPLLVQGSVDGNAQVLTIYPGIQTVGLPGGWHALGVKVPRILRVQVVIGGPSTATVEATVGCNLLT
jgi:hypothetical protein